MYQFPFSILILFTFIYTLIAFPNQIPIHFHENSPIAQFVFLLVSF